MSRADTTRASTVTIYITADNHFTIVTDDGRVCDGLAWDEMLGDVAQLTHQKLGDGRYQRTPEQLLASMEFRSRRRHAREGASS
jgi:hypothetical protein